MRYFFWLQCGISVFIGFLSYFLGGFDALIYALLSLVCIDYVSGVLCAVHSRCLSSKIGAKGIIKKIFIFMLVGAAHLADFYLLHDKNGLRTVVICFYSANEIISILENAACCGLPIPKAITNALNALKTN